MSWSPFISHLYQQLPTSYKNSNISMYVDDIIIFNQSYEITQLNEAIDSDLYQLEKWLEGNELSLHVVKTHEILISTN